MPVSNAREFEAYQAGQTAQKNGKCVTDCPHPMRGKTVTTIRAAWFKGYNDSKKWAEGASASANAKVAA